MNQRRFLLKRRDTRSKRGCSSAGRAPALQAGGQRFDPAQLHHGSDCEMSWKNKVCTALDECVPVLSKIVKRRYVRMNELNRSCL